MPGYFLIRVNGRNVGTMVSEDFDDCGATNKIPFKDKLPTHINEVNFCFFKFYRKKPKRKHKKCCFEIFNYESKRFVGLIECCEYRLPFRINGLGLAVSNQNHFYKIVKSDHR